MNWQDLDMHHIGIVVKDIDEAKKPYEEVFGLKVDAKFNVDVFSAKVAFLPLNNTYLELVEPTNPEDGLSKFLKGGGGIHHICYEVEDLGTIYQQLKKKNIRDVSGGIQCTPCFEKTLFLHPKDTGNVLIEVVEKATCKLPGCKY